MVGSKSKILIVVVAIFGIGLLFSSLPFYFFSLFSTQSTSAGAPPPGGLVGVGDLVSPAEELQLQTREPQSRLEIFTASISLRVNGVRESIDEISGIATQLGGTVAGSEATIFNGGERGTITIRVPKDRFTEAIDLIEELGELRQRQTTSDDVTEEYVDLQARLTNLDRQEERLQEILGLARNVDEVLKIENELERVRGEIERLTGRINYLESNVAMSTISVSLNQPGPAPFPEVDWFEPFRTGILFFFGGFRGVILAISAGIPVFVVGAPLYIGYRKLKARLNRGQEREPSRTA